MENLRLEHIYWVVGGLAVSLALFTFVLWLSTRPPFVVNLLVALKSRFVIDYDKLADRQVDDFGADDPAFPPPQETEINPVPSVSQAENKPGNAVSVSHTLEEATAYAEMILVDRLADLVMAGKLDKSVAIRVGLRAPTGRAYQAAKEKLETVMRSKEFPTLTKDGRPIARSLRTSAK
jgi:hypothetical protein